MNPTEKVKQANKAFHDNPSKDTRLNKLNTVLRAMKECQVKIGRDNYHHKGFKEPTPMTSVILKKNGKVAKVHFPNDKRRTLKMFHRHIKQRNLT